MDRRKFKFVIHQPQKGGRVVQVVAYVNGKRVRVLRGRRLRAPVDLRGLPRGRFKVTIKAVTRSGKRVTATRRYRTCVKRGRR